MFGWAKELQAMKRALEEARKALWDAIARLAKLRLQVRRLGGEPEA